jgi:hypothetical protein
MLKKPFNRETGEVRKCRVCDNDFHTHKPVWRCAPCSNEYQRKYVRGKVELKANYPFNNRTNEASNRFYRIHSELNKAWKKGPDAVKQHYDKQIKEIIDLGIWDWIFDRRSNDAKKEKVKKSRNTIRKNYPDTRGHYEE